MRVTYDKEADAVYIYLSEKSNVFKSKGEWPINFDLSKEGKLIGIEILQASQIVDIDNLKKIKFEKIG